MGKKRGLVIVTVLAIIFLFIDLSLKKFFNFFPKLDTVLGFIPVPSNVNISFVFFIVQWIILILIIFMAYLKFLRRRKREQIHPYEIETKKTKSETNLDVLYELLKDKKSLSIKAISNIFKIPKEKALEWAKILENYNLVTIEYPTFNVPEVKINEKEIKKQEPKEKASKKPAKDKTKKVAQKSFGKSQRSKPERKKKIKR